MQQQNAPDPDGVQFQRTKLLNEKKINNKWLGILTPVYETVKYQQIGFIVTHNRSGNPG